MTVHQSRLWEAEAARDQGEEFAWAGANPTWRVEAWRFLHRYCQANPWVFADDLWDAGLPATRENRALGPLIQRARRAGWIAPTNERRVSVRAHAQPHMVWRSLIYRGRERR